MAAAEAGAEGRGGLRALPIHTVGELIDMHIPEPDFVVGPPLALARGTVAELDAYPKDGKTRLTLDAIWSVQHGLPFLDAATQPVNVLYLTEEWLVTWRDALNEAHLLDQNADLHWMSLIALQGREAGDWPTICGDLRLYCRANEIGLLVVDTLARWAGVADENDAVAMAAAVLPLRLIAADNIAVLFLRHDRKGGGQLGQSGRGSSAATGEADQILHLQRKGGQGQMSLRQRELEGIGRLTGMTGKLVVELESCGHFALVGSKSDVALERAEQFLAEVLPSCRDEAWTVKELEGRFDGSTSTLNRAIEVLLKHGTITGQKGAGHAARSRGKRALGYWLPQAEQQGFEFDDG
jgi:hypothetical protein